MSCNSSGAIGVFRPLRRPTGPRAKGKRLTTLRAFFRFCVNRKWIPESPVSSDIKAPVGSSRAANKAPFANDEINRIVAACDGVKVESKNETGSAEWTGEDLKDLIWLMLYSGVALGEDRSDGDVDLLVEGAE